MASQSHRICLELRSRVRSSSSCRCGSWRWQKKRSCRVCACTGCPPQPGCNGHLPVAENSLSGGSVQPFGQRRQPNGDLLSRGFQPIQGRVASGTERAAASLTAKRLDALGPAMSAIANQGMNGSVCDPAVRALVVGTSETLGVDAFGGTSPAFDLA